MKLELKHIAPYLPYKLRLQISETNSSLDNFHVTMDRLDATDGVWAAYEWYDPNNGCVKPILRPLSDLDDEMKKELIRLREEFPIINLQKATDKSSLILFGVNDGRMKYDVSFHLDLEVMRISQWQKLFEWHFDVFGLIDKGLAIDINTIPR